MAREHGDVQENKKRDMEDNEDIHEKKKKEKRNRRGEARWLVAEDGWSCRCRSINYSSMTTLVTWTLLFIGEPLSLNCNNRLRIVLANVMKLPWS